MKKATHMLRYPFLNCSVLSPVKRALDFICSSRENQNGQQKTWKVCHIFKHLYQLANHISLPTSFMQSTVTFSLLLSPTVLHMKGKVPGYVMNHFPSGQKCPANLLDLTFFTKIFPLDGLTRQEKIIIVLAAGQVTWYPSLNDTLEYGWNFFPKRQGTFSLATLKLYRFKSL